MNSKTKKLIDELRASHLGAGKDMITFVRKSDVIKLIDDLTKWNDLTDSPKEDNILVIVKTKHKRVPGYRGFWIANYAFGKFECYNDNLIPFKWKLI